jgi:hypothetical protein
MNGLRVIGALVFAAATLAATAPSKSSLIVIEDFSGSLEGSSFAEARGALTEEMPSLLEELSIDRFEVRTFDTDGWQSHKVVDCSLPILELPVEESRADNESLGFRNIAEADREDRERRRGIKIDGAKAAYHRKLEPILKTILPLPSPADKYESPSSDIAGVFDYVASINSAGPTYVIVVTDLADTQFKELPVLPIPRSNVRVLLVLVPAKASEIKRTYGRFLTGSKQFELRVAQMHKAAPWAVIVPHMSHSYIDLLRPPALSKARG